MPTVTIDSITAIAANPGTTLTISGTWTGLTSVSIEFKCDDDNQEPQFVSLKASDITFNGNGTYTATAKTPCGCGQMYYVNVHGQYPGGEIVESRGPLTLDCIDCCPKAADVTVTPTFITQCTADCRRLTSLDITYQAKLDASCPQIGLISVTIRDSAGTNVHSWPPAWFTLAGPLQYLTIPAQALLPGQGYQAVIAVYATMAGAPLTCAEIVKTFDVPPCDHAPPCPTGLTLIAHDIGCSAGPNGDCLPTAQFVIEGTFGQGCGNLAETALLLDFGDGSPPTSVSMPAGSLQAVFDHQYASGGTKTASVTIDSPSGCAPALLSAQVKLQGCTAGDCVDCPPLPKPPAWCLCKGCWLFSQKPGRKWCKAFMLVVIGLIMVVTWAVLHGWVFGLKQPIGQLLAALLASFGSAVLLNYYSKYCGHCCAACAILPGFLLGVIASLISWLVYGNKPVVPFTVPPTNVIQTWILRLVTLLILMIALYIYHYLECKKEEKTKLNPDDWCKPDV